MKHFIVGAFVVRAVLAWAAPPANPEPQANLPGMLWRAPAAMTQQDWMCGPGGCDRRPSPPFRFLRADSEGFSPKVLVRDAKGLVWSVKFGAEVIPEVFAPRFLMALGYFGEPTYYVREGTIAGTPRLPARIRHSLHADGSFANARFELRDEKEFVFLPDRKWAWDVNPFAGSPQFAGLKIVMMLLSNWDAKDARDGHESNNAVFRWSGAGHPRDVYAVFDWGASLGRWGGFLQRDQSDCAGFTAQTPHFVEGVRNAEVQWGFSGKHAQDVKSDITVADVQWLMPYLQRITPEGLRTALAASGATPRQAGCWAASIQDRIAQLQQAARSAFQQAYTP